MRKKGDANDFFGSVALRNGELTFRMSSFWLSYAENVIFKKIRKSQSFPTGKGRTGVFLNAFFSLPRSPFPPTWKLKKFTSKKF